jgi:hypothetical protein
MFKKLMISCDEATLICDKSQYKEASWSEKLKLKWHFFQCKICKLYSVQNNRMTLFYKTKASSCKPHQHFLSQADKDKLAKELNSIKR